MSWSANLPEGYTPQEGFDLDPATFGVSPPYDALHPEPKEQFEAAVAAANRVIESGVLGPADGSRTFNVSLSGHANPDHEPTPGWSNDHVTISISQRTES